jgi:hypothetical protein
MQFRDFDRTEYSRPTAIVKARTARLTDDRYLALLTAFLPAAAILLAAGAVMTRLLGT